MDKTNTIDQETTMALYAVLIASSEPIAKAEIQNKLNIPEEAFKDGLIALKELLATHSPLFVSEFNDKLLLMTRPEFANYVRAIHKTQKQRLSQEALETLSIIAYKQPVTKSEIDKIRGVDCESTIISLSEYGLIKAIGTLQRAGSPAIYQTTDKFLQVFGLNKLADLPDMDQI